MANWVKDFLQEHPELSDRIVKRAKHAIHTLNDDGTVTARFTGAPMHYQDGEGIWRELDTAIKDLGDGTFGAEGIPIRLLQSGLVKLFNAQNEEFYSQVTSRVAVYNANTDNIVDTYNLSTGVIDDDKLVKDTSLYTHTLTLKETGLREEILIKERPSFITDDVNLWFVLDTVITGFEFADGWLDDEHSKEEFRFTLPRAHDAEGRKGNPRQYAKKINGVQHIFTGLKFSELYNASYPVTIDPDFACGTADGDIFGQDLYTYATARSTSSDSEQGDNTVNVGQYSIADSLFTIYRAFILFDTSSIPDGDSVTQVNLKLTVNSDNSTTDFDVQIVKTDWSSNTTFSNATQRENAYDACLANDADDNIWRNTSGISANTTYTSGNLNTAWVSKTGTTYYGLRSSRDKSNTQPSGDEFIVLHTQEASTTSYRPVLVVTHEEVKISPKAMHYVRLRG